MITTTTQDLVIESSQPLQIDSSLTTVIVNGGNLTINAPNLSLINSSTTPSLGVGGNIILNTAGIIELNAAPFELMQTAPVAPVNFTGFLAEQRLTDFYENGDQLIQTTLTQLNQQTNQSLLLLVIDNDVRLQEADLRNLEQQQN